MDCGMISVKHWDKAVIQVLYYCRIILRSFERLVGDFIHQVICQVAIACFVFHLSWLRVKDPWVVTVRCVCTGVCVCVFVCSHTGVCLACSLTVQSRVSSSRTTWGNPIQGWFVLTLSWPPLPSLLLLFISLLALYSSEETMIIYCCFCLTHAAAAPRGLWLENKAAEAAKTEEIRRKTGLNAFMLS